MVRHPVRRRRTRRRSTMHIQTRRSCNLRVGRQVRKEQRSRPGRSRRQNVAIAFSKVRKRTPACKRFIRK